MGVGQILIVDDDSSMNKAMQAYLKEYGIDCDCVIDKRSALGKAKSKEYDLILIDYELQEAGEGIRLAAQIQKRWPNTICIPFTAQKNLVDEATKKGCENFASLKNDQSIDETVLVATVFQGITDSLRRKADWYSQIIDSAGFGAAIVHSGDGSVIWGNKVLEEVLDRQPLEGKVYAECTREAKKLQQLRDIETVKTYSAENDFWEVVNSSLSADDGFELYTWRNITQRQRVENIITNVLKAEKFGSVVNTLCDELNNLFPRVRLWLMTGDGEKLSLERYRGYLPRETIDKPSLVDLDFSKDRTTQELFQDYPRKNPAARKFSQSEYKYKEKELGKENVPEWLEIPLYRSLSNSIEIIGKLSADFLRYPDKKPEQKFSKEDEVFGFLISPLASFAIDYAKTLWIRERVRQIDQTVSDKLATDFEEIFRTIYKSFGEQKWLLEWDSMDVWMRDQGTIRDKMLRLLTIQSGAVENLEEVFPERIYIRGLIEEAIQKIREKPDSIPLFENLGQNPVFIKYLEELSKDAENEKFVEYLKSVVTKVVLPLFDVNQKLLGVVCFHHRTPAKVTKSHERWLLTLQFRIARVLDIKELIEKIQELRQRLDNTGALRIAVETNRGLVHELRNILQLMRNRKAHAMGMIKDNNIEKLTEDFGDLSTLIESASQRINTLHAFFKGTSGRLGEIDIRTVLQDILKITEYEPKAKDIALKLDLNPVSPVMWSVDAARMAFMNIVLNAFEAMEETSERILDISLGYNEDKDSVLVVFRDTGCGIPPKNRNKIFDPHFTTKEGRGLGVGLSYVLQSVNIAGGEIDFDSSVGIGTTFRIKLPIVRKDYDERALG